VEVGPQTDTVARGAGVADWLPAEAADLSRRIDSPRPQGPPPDGGYAKWVTSHAKGRAANAGPRAHSWTN